MTAFFHHESQQTKFTDHSPLIIQSKMPSFYPSTGHRTLITKHLTEHDDANSNSINKEEFIIQIFQHWKLKASEHQHEMNNPDTLNTSNHFPYIRSNTVPFVESSKNTEPSSTYNKEDEGSDIHETEKPITTMKKRVTPLPASYTSRKAALKKSLSTPNELLNPHLLAPHTKNKFTTTVTTTTPKKPIKPTPIFIAPKKTQPSFPRRSFTVCVVGEDAHTKRKAFAEKRNSIIDEKNPPLISPNWAPPSARCYPQSPTSPIDDDETSSDESDHESLLIRNKKGLKKPTKTKENYSLSIHPNIIIPTAVFITDPNGNIHTLDLNSDFTEEFIDTTRIIENDYMATNSISSSSSTQENPPTSEILLDKYALHSIGEEEEEGPIEKYGNIQSKEANHMRILTQSQQKTVKEQKQTIEENNNSPIERRWSDSIVSDDEEHLPVRQPSVVKTASATSVMKQSITPPAKVSFKKYLLMKLHLTSSSSIKDDESNISSTNLPPPPRKRTVRRSSDKKHSRTVLETPQSSIDDSKQPSNITNINDIQKSVSETDSKHNPEENIPSKPSSIRNRESVADSDEDIDNKFPKAKRLGPKRALSFQNIFHSQSSTFSETNAHYDLDTSGTIELKLSFNSDLNALEVFIKNCTNLARAKRNQTSNPYCKTYLLPDESKASKRKTTVRKGTLAPVYDETLRYHLSIQDFDSRILWVSVWSQSSIGQNDFLGEIHIPLVHCVLDEMKEYTLLARVQNNNVASTIEPRDDGTELSFELTFIENQKNEEFGTIQVNAIQGQAIYSGKHPVDALCKGLLMPDKIKRKLPTVRKGPSPKWDIPLRWENIRRSNLKKTSVEISIWSQERFRKSMLGFVRLTAPTGNTSNRLLDVTEREKAAWEEFLRNPTKVHHCRLPLRPAITETK